MTIPGFPDQYLSLCSNQGFVSFGDSLSIVGFGPPTPQIDTYVTALGLQPVDFLEAGRGGVDCSDLLTYYAATVAPFYRADRPRNAVALVCGTNDLGPHGKTAAQSYADIVALVALVKATGYTVSVQTVPDSVPIHTRSGGDAIRADLNTQIRNGAATYGYAVADLGGDAQMGCNGCSSDATYFADGTHPTTAGRIIQAGYLKTALQALGFK